MKIFSENTRINKFFTAPFHIGVFLLLLGFADTTFADIRYWVGGATGNWNDTSNWDLGANGPGGFSVPVSGDVARVTSDDGLSRTVTYQQPNAYSLGNLRIDATSGGNMQLNIAQDVLKAGAGIVGFDGTATVNLSGGTLEIATFIMGSGSSSSGTINLSGSGLLKSTNTTTLGSLGAGTIHQTGGSAEFSSLNFGSNGNYTLDAEASAPPIPVLVPASSPTTAAHTRFPVR